MYTNAMNVKKKIEGKKRNGKEEKEYEEREKKKPLLKYLICCTKYWKIFYQNKVKRKSTETKKKNKMNNVEKKLSKKYLSNNLLKCSFQIKYQVVYFKTNDSSWQ